jgi:transcriptional regulator with XRE-family HTH domain
MHNLQVMAQRFDSHHAIAALAQRIREARKARNLTLLDLAKATKVNHGQISRMERGQFATKSNNVRIICTFLKIKDATITSPKARIASLQKRFELLLNASPQYQQLFAAFFDALETQSPSVESGAPR